LLASNQSASAANGLAQGRKVFLRRIGTFLIRFKRKLQGATQSLIAHLLQGLAVSRLPLKFRLPCRFKLDRSLGRTNAAGTSRALRRLGANNVHAPLRCWRKFAAFCLCRKLLAASKRFTRTGRKLLLQLPRLTRSPLLRQNPA
jgi:hypothetical protein